MYKNTQPIFFLITSYIHKYAQVRYIQNKLAFNNSWHNVMLISTGFTDKFFVFQRFDFSIR